MVCVLEGLPRRPGAFPLSRAYTHRETVLASAWKGTDNDVTTTKRDTKAPLARAVSTDSRLQGEDTAASPSWAPRVRAGRLTHTRSHTATSGQSRGPRGLCPPAQRPDLPTTLLPRASHETDTTQNAFPEAPVGGWALRKAHRRPRVLVHGSLPPWDGRTRGQMALVPRHSAAEEAPLV